MNDITETLDKQHIRKCIELAEQAKGKGNHPFGAILVNSEGTILLEAENTVVTTRDRTSHAERNLMTTASMHYSEEFLQTCTLYSSAEPCVMCSGAAYWAGIGTVVFGLRESILLQYTGDHPENKTFSLSCEVVLNSGQRTIEVRGPILEKEAAISHQGFWKK